MRAAAAAASEEGIDKLNLKVINQSQCIELLNLLGGMTIGGAVGGSQETSREEVEALEAQLGDVFGERNQFMALSAQWEARCEWLEGELARANKQVAAHHHQILTLDDTIAQMDCLGTRLQEQVKQQQLTIEEMKRKKEDLLVEGNGLLERVSVLEESLEKKQEEKQKACSRKKKKRSKSRKNKTKGKKEARCQGN